ncbi:hypothetical protein BJX99DRAFT_260673 [Aspergillus californicus]
MGERADMETADDDGYSIYTDIGDLGSAFYEAITGERCHFELRPDHVSQATWPRRETLPGTKDVWLGSIIEKCWPFGAYKNALDLAGELDATVLEDTVVKTGMRF